ncbi:MAG: YfiR family protein [Herminiimonas sp.]|nr:YfiR family protein [Herminiimonas sp.]
MIAQSVIGIHPLALILSLLAPGIVPGIATAQNSAIGTNAIVSEEGVKAAYLYRFLQYVDWPVGSFQRPDSPFVIGIVNNDDIADHLVKAVAGRSVNNRIVTVKKLHPGDGVAGINLLFVGNAEKQRLVQWLRQSKEHPMLVVSDADDALAKGSMINFRIVDERVRFEVALDPVEKSGLKLNSRILTVALSVIKGTVQ